MAARKTEGPRMTTILCLAFVFIMAAVAGIAEGRQRK